MKKSLFLPVIIAALTLVGCSEENHGACRKMDAGQIKSFVEADFIKRIAASKKSQQMPMSTFDAQTVNVILPSPGRSTESGIDWNTKIIVQSDGPKKSYEVMVYFSCDHGIDYSAAKAID